jgi:probable phosphoglycerate mutase
VADRTAAKERLQGFTPDKRRRTADIRAERPDSQLFHDGCSGRESPAHVAARAVRAVSRLRAVLGDALLFSSGYFLRVLAVRWLGLKQTAHARSFMLRTASLIALGYEGSLSRAVIRLWNETRHTEK